jgi:hypothetical protein
MAITAKELLNMSLGDDWECLDTLLDVANDQNCFVNYEFTAEEFKQHKIALAQQIISTVLGSIKEK